MEVLILWVCATAAMDNCTVERLTPVPVEHRRCEDLTALYQKTLGTGPDQNYRFECKPVGEA